MVHINKCIDRYLGWEFEAFGEIYEEYIDQIFAFILRKTSDREAAEDLTSQVWIKVMRRLESYEEKEGASFTSWVYCIANNTVIDYYRTQKEKANIDDIAVIWISEDLAQVVDDRDKLREVRDFLKDLKPIEEEVVVLRVWDDLTYREIAEITGKKEDNCKQIYKRTVEKIQANLMILCLCLILFL